MATTAANGVLGLLFWIAAARLFSSNVVGLGAAGVSALQLVATVGWVGLQFTVMRYIPTAGGSSRKLLLYVYGAGCAAALAVAVTFCLTLAGTFRVTFITTNALAAAAFCGAVMVWVIFSLQDAALTGIRRAGIIPLENASYGALKLVALVVCASIVSPWTFVAVWVLAAAVLAVVINSMLFARLLTGAGREPAISGPATSLPSGLPPARAIRIFSMGHTAASVIAWVPDFLVPLLILRSLGSSQNAYYYAAWTIGFSARLLSVNIANAFTVESVYDTDRRSSLLGPAARLLALVIAPVLVVMVVAADPILRLFGPDYVHAATVIRLFALSLIPFAVSSVIIALDRVNGSYRMALPISTVATASCILIDVVLLPSRGIAGAGIGWLVGQTLGAGLGLILVRRRKPSERPSPMPVSR
jgi:O-antigen/teichoic acid export membrane protein